MNDNSKNLVKNKYDDFVKENVKAMIIDSDDTTSGNSFFSDSYQSNVYSQGLQLQPQYNAPVINTPYPNPSGYTNQQSGSYPQNQPANYPQWDNSVQQPSLNTTSSETTIQTVNISSQNIVNDYSDFSIIYKENEPAMYLCKMTRNATSSGEIQSSVSQKIIKKSGGNQKTSTKLIASGCAKFNRLIKRSTESSISLLCEIQVQGTAKNTLEFQIGEISSQKSSIKTALSEYGISFVSTDGFKKWCTDITRQINSATPIKERSGYYKENGVWYCVGIDASNSNFSEQLCVLSPFLENLRTYRPSALEELTLILYGLISMMFTVFKDENLTAIANLILVNSDTHRIANELKNLFQLSEGDSYDDSSKSLNKLNSCKNNTTPMIVLSDKVPQNKNALEFILKCNDLNCFPLLIAKSFDNVCKSDDSQNYLLLKVQGSFPSSIFKIIEIFRCELLAASDFINLIQFQIQRYLNRFSELDLDIKSRVQNTYALMLALIQTILPKVGFDKTDELCDKYFEFLLNGDSAKSIDVDTLRYILTSDTDFNRLNKKFCSSLNDNTIYFSDSTITLNITTMLNIAKKFGFSKNNTFSAALKPYGLLDTAESSNSKVVSVNGNSVRAYSFSIDKTFSFGDFIPDCQSKCFPMYSVPIGSLSRDRTISFSVGENENNMMYVSGQSGSGKTNFCNNVAEQAAKKNMSVVIIGNNSSISDLCSEATKYIINSPQEPIRWNEINQSGRITKVTSYDDECDHLLSSFYEFHQKINQKIHTLLILDEVQDFNWDEGSPLRDLLRQGRKFGISIVLSTQYLNAGNGKDINNALKQCTSFCFFYGADIPKHIVRKYQPINDSVHELNKYEALLVGNFTVNGIHISAPLRYKTDKS